MCGQVNADGKDKSRNAGFACCPENIRDMFSRMSECCSGKDNLPDCEEIMSRMKASCCIPESKAEKK